MENVYILGQFKTKVILHIAIITGILIVGAYVIIVGGSYFTLSIILACLLYSIYSLFSISNKTNRDLTNFLLSIQYNDFESTYTQKENQSKDKDSLYKAFNLITGKFRDIRSEKEAQHQFLLALVEQVETGIICFDQNGTTVLMNHAFQNLLRKSYLPSIDSLKKIDPDLYNALVNFKPGERHLLKIEVQNEHLELAFVGTIIKSNDQTVRLFSFQNIRSELDYQEIESWSKLIRILTHEIMNSVTPVVSLAATTDDIITSAKGIEENTRTDIHQAINAIKKRGELLLDFTRKYRQFTRVPPPEIENFDFKELVERMIVLQKAEIEKANITLKKQFPLHKVNLDGDESLLEQALINLFKNAIEAVEGHQHPTIELNLYKDGGSVIFQIADNGDGIEEKMLDQIFIPFFTTKAQGSGIGLSLCRQIIVAHRGRIDVHSELGKGTVFKIRF